MAKAFDPKISSVASILYVTPASTARGFIYGYQSAALTRYNPKGVVAKPGTLETGTTW